MRIAELVNRCLAPFNIHVSRQRPHEPFAELANLPSVRSLIDVGVGYGTPELYRWFPTARLILVEPNPKFHATLRENVLADRDGALYTTAAGRAEAEAELQLAGTKTSFLTRTALTALPERGQTESARVAIQPLDRIVEDEPLSRPALLKIDTEGYEMEVLRGATATLARIDYVLAEVSVMKRFEDSYEFLDLCNYMAENGFRMHYLLTANRNNQGVIPFVDLLFARQPARRESS